MNNNKRSKNIVPAFITAAVLEENNRDHETNSTNPSDNAVRRAKDWVETNKK